MENEVEKGVAAVILGWVSFITLGLVDARKRQAVDRVKIGGITNDVKEIKSDIKEMARNFRDYLEERRNGR